MLVDPKSAENGSHVSSAVMTGPPALSRLLSGVLDSAIAAVIESTVASGTNAIVHNEALLSSLEETENLKS